MDWMRITLFVCSCVNGLDNSLTAFLNYWTLDALWTNPNALALQNIALFQIFRRVLSIAYMSKILLCIYFIVGCLNIKSTLNAKLTNSNIPNTWFMAMFANRLSRLVSKVALPRSSSSFHETTPFWSKSSGEHWKLYEYVTKLTFTSEGTSSSP